MPAKKCIIVIPIYKPTPSENEVLSLLQCFKMLGEYQVAFVAPHSLDTTLYEEAANANKISFRTERFKDSFFTGLLAYSRLLLNINFYKRFSDFEYLLIYQLDAWVFRNDLDLWMNKGYDYIGAPWFEGFATANKDSNMLVEAGNGGLSLRKVPSIIKALQLRSLLHYMKNWDFIYAKFKKKHFISNFLNLPRLLRKRYGLKNTVYFFLKTTESYEDYIFASILPRINKEFKVAPPAEAMYFSFEVQPSRLYNMTNKILPFGCHAWEKYEPDFWADFIDTKVKLP